MEPGSKSGEARSAGQQAVRGLVCESVARVCRAELGRRMRSLLLTGSVARDEATILVHPGGRRLLGDADFIVVVEPHAPLPPAGAVAALAAKCESDLRAAGVVAHIGIAAVHDDYFPRLPAHIFTYELRCCGRVVCGDDNPLELIPRFLASAIDKEDAWRLLANRTIECLELSENLSYAPAAGSGTPAPEELHYRAVKLFLDMATSLLVFLDAYEPTYAQRARRLQELAERLDGQAPHYAKSARSGDPARLPFALKPLAARVDECTRWKIARGGDDCDFGSEITREVLDYACRLWPWELAQLTSLDADAPAETLFAAAAARQSAGQKLRGWLYVARRVGWLRGMPSWPRWAAMGWGRTPRYFIYEAAWRLAAGASCALDEREYRRITALLPIAGANHKKKDDGGRQQLIREVAWNYRTFLTDTRA